MYCLRTHYRTIVLIKYFRHRLPAYLLAALLPVSCLHLQPRLVSPLLLAPPPLVHVSSAQKSVFHHHLEDRLHQHPTFNFQRLLWSSSSGFSSPSSSSFLALLRASSGPLLRLFGPNRFFRQGFSTGSGGGGATSRPMTAE